MTQSAGLYCCNEWKADAHSRSGGNASAGLEHVHSVAHLFQATGILKRIKAQVRCSVSIARADSPATTKPRPMLGSVKLGLSDRDSSNSAIAGSCGASNNQNPSKVRMSPRQIWIPLLGLSVKDPNGVRLFAKDKHMRPETMQSPGAAPAVLTMAIQCPSERPWILGRSATGSREADLSVFAKLFEDRLKWRLEAETFSRR